MPKPPKGLIVKMTEEQLADLKKRYQESRPNKIEKMDFNYKILSVFEEDVVHKINEIINKINSK